MQALLLPKGLVAGMGALASAGISPEVLGLGKVLQSGAGAGILTAAGVAQSVAEATGGTVEELAKSEGFKVTVMEVITPERNCWVGQVVTVPTERDYPRS